MCVSVGEVVMTGGFMLKEPHRLPSLPQGETLALTRDLTTKRHRARSGSCNESYGSQS